MPIPFISAGIINPGDPPGDFGVHVDGVMGRDVAVSSKHRAACGDTVGDRRRTHNLDLRRGRREQADRNRDDTQHNQYSNPGQDEPG